MKYSVKDLKIYSLELISDLICGNEPYNRLFPYRSSSFLTAFFRDLELPYIHDGTTRKSWVIDVLNKENSTVSGDNILSVNILRIIENLFQIKYYIRSFNQEHNRNYFSNPEPNTIAIFTQAVELFNNKFKTIGLEVKVNQADFSIEINHLNRTFISSAVKGPALVKKVEFSPVVFSIPDKEINPTQVAVMMPFAEEYAKTFLAITNACEKCGLYCLRADQTWENSSVIQDIFDLIYTSNYIIADFTGKNPNVYYEVGIAHTLGKIVVPISQNVQDIPFDLRHHRHLAYLPNSEGYLKLENDLSQKLSNQLDIENINLRKNWNILIKKIRDEMPALYILLAEAFPYSFRDNILTIFFKDNFVFHKSKVTDEPNLNSIGVFTKRFFGENTILNIKLESELYGKTTKE